ncbi:MAG: HD domain-containing protein [Alphaproteobacteria bacterium]|nr:HD domain-containing protein [Alphaproteobacteria bacterium]
MRENEELAEKVKACVKSLLSGEKSGHGEDHALRVCDIAARLCQGQEADEKVVALAALLHDCDDYKVFGQECADNLTNAVKIMDQCGVEPSCREKVLDIIRNMGYSKLLQGIRPATVEGEIVSDADMLEGLGAIGIIRTLRVKFYNNEPVFDRDVWPDINITQEKYKRKSFYINHFFEKLLRLKNLMFTEAGKAEAAKRHETTVIFLRAFFQEQNLPDWLDYLEEFLENNGLAANNASVMQMRLDFESFTKIKDGVKNIELRLCDEKRRQLKLGDNILFINRENDETLPCKIVGLCRFRDFGALVESLGAKQCGWDKEISPEDADADMEQYYPRDDIKKYGALGIVLERA